jgi:hypothetical protein
MNKLLAAVLLSLACSGASAATWPWQEPALGESWDFCMGLVLGGLDSKQVGGMSRSELWQAWSYLIRSGALKQIAPTNEFKTGLARFQGATDADSAETIIDDATGDCGIGRSGYQITGW